MPPGPEMHSDHVHWQGHSPPRSEASHLDSESRTTGKELPVPVEANLKLGIHDIRPALCSFEGAEILC
jgi:hypothetical protein